jgi:coenzyme F420-dependent glucose-6-phosphate dehydrogenase
MTELGYSLSSEETAPADLVTYAQEAEDAGFNFSLISDHFHPGQTRNRTVLSYGA